MARERDDRNNAQELKGKLPKKVFYDNAKWLMVPSKIVLDCLSVWPERQNKITNLLNALCVTSFVLAIIGQVIFITDKDVDLGSLAYAITFLILSIETTVRRILCYIYKKQLKQILHTIYFQFWPSDIVGSRLHEELFKDSWYLFIYCAGYMIVAVLFVLQIILIPILYGNLPMRTKYPFPWYESPYYGLLYVWESFLGIEMAFNVCGLDLFFVSLLSNCVAQFKLLRVYLEQKFKIANEKQDTLEDDCNLPLEVLITCIRKHTELIRVCKEINEVFTYFILVQYLASIGTVCLSTFVAIAIPKELITALTYFMGHFCEIFIYCYMGEILINESTKLSNIAFTCGWHLGKLNREVQKTLVLVMVRAQRPTKISAGGFGFLSLSSFMKLVQFSFSVFTLLNSMMKKQKYSTSHT